MSGECATMKGNSRICSIQMIGTGQEIDKKVKISLDIFGMIEYNIVKLKMRNS